MYTFTCTSSNYYTPGKFREHLITKSCSLLRFVYFLRFFGILQIFNVHHNWVMHAKALVGCELDIYE